MRQQRLGIGGHHRANSGGARDVWLTPPGYGAEALARIDRIPWPRSLIEKWI